MTRPWEIPASALLDARWNQALDLAAAVPVSPVKIAAAWEAQGPDRVLASLRKLTAVVEGKGAATTGDAA